MPGEGAKERRKQREQTAIEAWKRKRDEYLANGGIKNCRSCVTYSWCPVDGDDIRPCWVYGGK